MLRRTLVLLAVLLMALVGCSEDKSAEKTASPSTNAEVVKSTPAPQPVPVAVTPAPSAVEEDPTEASTPTPTAGLNPTPAITTAQPAAAPASPETVEIKALPKDMAEFKQMMDTMGSSSPQGGAAVFIAALLVYNQNASLGLQMVDAALHPKHKPAGKIGASLKDKLNRLKEHPEIVRSYIQGTLPDQNYKLPALPFTLRFRADTQNLAGPNVKFYIYSTGADNARPVKVRRVKNGNWLISDAMSIMLMVRKPEPVY